MDLGDLYDRKLYSLGFWLAALTLSGTAQAAYNVRIGESLFEQGDYILAPGLQVAFDRGTDRIRVDFSGREFGPFLEATALISYDRSISILNWKNLSTHYGITIMDEYTAFNNPKGKDESIHSMNIGVNFGLGYTLYRWRQLDLCIDWNSHLFAAGQAFILMTTARKTIFTLSAGYDL